MSTLTMVSTQWANRPDDQRFASLTELNDFCRYNREHSQGLVVSTKQLKAEPLNSDPTHKSLLILGPKGEETVPSHWSFGQLAARVGAPASYLRTLPAPFAADCINYGLQVNRDIEDLGVLLYKNGGAPELRAVTGPQYGRIWNADITQSLVDRFGDGLTGDFRVPGEFGQDITVTKANTTLYASDRDVFIFLADEKRRITIPNRKPNLAGGSAGTLARGFVVWNSETGGRSYGIAAFLFDYACCNRMIWGAEGYIEIRGRHTASASDKWFAEIEPAIHAYSEASVAPIEAKLIAAQKKKIDDVEEFLMKRFTKTQVASMITVHQVEEARPIESLWDATTAVTAYARGIKHQDQRVELEREAGRILDLAA